MKKYQPSNGTEGEGFMENYCYNCIHERWVHRQDEDKEEDKCDILSRSMIHDVKDKEYPSEWTYDENNRPICTKFSKFDWGGDDDRREPPPKPYEPPPNQLMLFSISDDMVKPEVLKKDNIIKV